MAGRLVDRFGAQAVYGRPLGYGEMQSILAAETVVGLHREMKASGNWAEWAAKNQEGSRYLLGVIETNGERH